MTGAPPTLSTDSQEFQAFLDNQQYSRKGILKYEAVFGEGFISPGGIGMAEKVTSMLGLKKGAGQVVLDVGCGIGGSSFLMSKNYGASVVGVDLSQNMIDIANSRAKSSDSDNVKFLVNDASTAEYEEGQFDGIYSRDVFLHIEDKQALFSKFHRWLKPGGKLVITDYCCSAEERSPEFAAYVASRGYHLLPPSVYGETLVASGFEAADVVAEDQTSQFIEVLQGELKAVTARQSEFEQQFSAEDFAEIASGWTNKIERCSNGQQRWGVFVATKSST